MANEERKQEKIAPVQLEQEVEQEIERPYQLRELKDRDLMPMLNILRKIGVREFKEAFFKITAGKDEIKEMGIGVALNVVDILIGNIGKAEEDIYALWADISGLDVETIKNMEFGTLPLMIMDTFKKARNTSFFKVLSKFL